jgi:hypothetical protein
MSLWTPGGEVPVDRNRDADPRRTATDRTDQGMSGRVGGPDLEDLSPDERAQYEQMVTEMAEVQRQVLAAPAAQVITNHVAGFYELAALHLSQEDPRFDEAQVAIDAMSGVLGAVGDRLGEHTEALRAALNQLQLAFVQRKGEIDGA